MERVYTIHGRLPGLNEYTKACRGSHFSGASMKRKAQEAVMWQLTGSRVAFARPVAIAFDWYEKDRRRDLDNIVDALVKRGVLADDGQKHVVGLSDRFFVDAKDPRVVVTITEDVRA